MFFKKTRAPDSPATRSAEKPNRDRREDGEADVIDVPQAEPQADGDSGPKPAEQPAQPVDHRANGWKGR